MKPSDPTPRERKASRIADQQWGVIGWEQLRGCDVTRSVACRWREAGRLHPIHRAVYALGHAAIPPEGYLVAAILHAGAGAALSHATAAWWWGLTKDRPAVIHVSTPTRARSTRGVLVHHPRHIAAPRHRHLPVTTVARTIEDLERASTVAELKRLLAQADYLGLLRPTEIQGGKKMQQALQAHLPRLALTRSELESRFIELCERAGLPLPRVNEGISLMTVDAVWPAQRLAVELDGYGNHHTPAQLERDRKRELQLRREGFTVIRYAWGQISDEPALVVSDLRAHLT